MSPRSTAPTRRLALRHLLAALSAAAPLVAAASPALALEPARFASLAPLPSPAGADAEPTTASAPVATPVDLAPRSRDRAEPLGKAAYVPHGFTMELGLGVAHRGIDSAVSSREKTSVGLAPLSLSLGGFLSPKVALLARAAGTTVFRQDSEGRAYQLVNAFYGPSIQYWATDRTFAGLGVGLGVLTSDPLAPRARPERFIELGVASTARVGWAFAVVDKHAFTLGCEAMGSFLPDSFVSALAVNLQWQVR
jgi:hypothetical protein